MRPLTVLVTCHSEEELTRLQDALAHRPELTIFAQQDDTDPTILHTSINVTRAGLTIEEAQALAFSMDDLDLELVGLEIQADPNTEPEVVDPYAI